MDMLAIRKYFMIFYYFKRPNPNPRFWYRLHPILHCLLSVLIQLHVTIQIEINSIFCILYTGIDIFKESTLQKKLYFCRFCILHIKVGTVYTPKSGWISESTVREY